MAMFNNYVSLPDGILYIYDYMWMGYDITIYNCHQPTWCDI